MNWILKSKTQSKYKASSQFSKIFRKKTKVVEKHQEITIAFTEGSEQLWGRWDERRVNSFPMDLGCRQVRSITNEVRETIRSNGETWGRKKERAVGHLYGWHCKFVILFYLFSLFLNNTKSRDLIVFYF